MQSGPAHRQFTAPRTGSVADGTLGGGVTDIPPRPVRIMPLGDSITAGLTSTGGAGYRDELLGHLHRLGHDACFAGPCVNAFQPQGDPGYAAVCGITIEALTSLLPQWVPAARPDWLLVHIGTNNMYGPGHTAAPGLLRTFVETLLGLAPSAGILLASIIPSRLPEWQAHIDGYNRRVREIAEEYGRRERVFFVDMAPALHASPQGGDDLSDLVHPCDQGYAKMAAVWRDALHARLPAPEGGPVLNPNPHLRTPCLSEAVPRARGSAPVRFPGWTNHGVNACHGPLAGLDNGSNAVGLSAAPGCLGIATRLATTPGRPVRVTFRARADTGPDRGRTFGVQADGHPRATVTATDEWRTWTYDFTPTGAETALRFTPDTRTRTDRGPLITDVLARAPVS
ncbi:SGNH/GDSL hydrolase family protein [Streptomyces sp. WELS2]|uniref:SGNH/GDSL hydrolase family protein n=1 Tax=Streptomyces sp. WELS2 TaxID=2749435 RepID=UPI0015F06C89|nr:SGNH/GDSL hydrolase family protein [Streptomyces sp. WELS2]